MPIIVARSQQRRKNHEPTIHARNTYGFTRACRWSDLSAPFERLSRQSDPQTTKSPGKAAFPIDVDTSGKTLPATRRFDGNRLTGREYSAMNRSAECLVDVGCLHEFSVSATQENGKMSRPRRVIETLNLWYERSRQRRDLLKLASDMSLLDDLGLSIYDIRREARKHFWNE